MGAITNITDSATHTYAGFAWEFLRRNPDYRIAFERSRAAGNPPRCVSSGGSILRINTISKAASKWGLQSFADPSLSYLDAHVFWTHTAFTRALPIVFKKETSSSLSEKSIRFSDILCTRHHLITADGQRETVLKSPYFWLQFYGHPISPTKENGRIIFNIDGGTGMRKRLEALQNLVKLRDKKPVTIRADEPYQMFENLQFYLKILDLKPLDMSYREMASLILGEARTEADWDSHGCSLKSKMIRGASRAFKLMESDYLLLLSR